MRKKNERDHFIRQIEQIHNIYILTDATDILNQQLKKRTDDHAGDHDRQTDDPVNLPVERQNTPYCRLVVFL